MKLWLPLLALVFLGHSLITTTSAAPPVRTASKPTAAPAKKPVPKPIIPQYTSQRGQARKVVPVDPQLQAAAIASAETIDQMVAKNLRANNLTANPMADDATLGRRIYLDISGTIPTSAQARLFIRNSSKDKVHETVDKLLSSPGYVSHSFNYWADMLRIVDRRDATDLGLFGEWVKQSLADNQPYNEFVHDMIAAEGSLLDNPAVGYQLGDENMPFDNLNNTVRIFLGTRIGCAQCHNHPTDRWTQKEFYEMAAFYGGMKYNRGLPAELTKITAYNRNMTESKAPKPEGWLWDKTDYFSTEGKLWRNSVSRQYRKAMSDATKNNDIRLPHDYSYDDAKPKDVVKPRAIFGNSPTLKPGQTRREAFADWLTSEENPRFTLSIANRLWKRVFGVGLIEPEDDMTDYTVATNPELLEYLVSELKRLNYDQKEFLRILYYTKTYQREATYEDLDPVAPYHFPGPVLRRLSSEQVWDSLITLTIDNPDNYTRPSNREFFQLCDVSDLKTSDDILKRLNEVLEYNKVARKAMDDTKYKGNTLVRASELPSPLPANHFLRQFGQGDRQTIASATNDGNVPQLLAMFNGAVTHMMLEEGSEIYNNVISRKSVDDQLDEIFLTLLSRYPTNMEKAASLREFKANGKYGYGNVIWALLNTREFLFIE